jgi:hypothetical protein
LRNAGLKNGLKAAGLKNGLIAGLNKGLTAGLKRGLIAGFTPIVLTPIPTGACTTVVFPNGVVTIAEALPANTSVMANNAVRKVTAHSMCFIPFLKLLMTSSSFL